jgi:hypothetical protein
LYFIKIEHIITITRQQYITGVLGGKVTQILTLTLWGVSSNTDKPETYISCFSKLASEAGCDDLLSRDQHLFDKGLDTILQASDCKLQQWTISVRLAQQRLASAVEDYKALLHAERELMQ